MIHKAKLYFIYGLVLLVASVLVPIWFYQTMPHLLSRVLFTDKLNAQQISFLADHIQKNYVEPIDEQRLMKNALMGMTEQLDPYSYYVERDAKEDFDRLTSGELTGIGIEFALKDEGMVILQVFRGGPAEKAGLKINDRFTEIDGQDVKTLKNTTKIIQLIKGVIKTPVTIKVFRPEVGKEISFEVIRDRVEIPSVQSSEVSPGVFHIHLDRFQGHSDSQMKEALQKATPLKGVVLDLRGNSGGRLDMAISIASFFLAKGTVVVKEKYRDREPIVHRVKQSGLWLKTPMVVLVDQYSASASEVLAGCLQDHKRATLWGQKTFGKGLVQELLTLEEGKSLLKLTVAKYLTPLGRDIGRGPGGQEGLKPDFEIELPNHLTNKYYLDSIKEHWEVLQIPEDFDTFIKNNPPGRTDGTYEDVVLKRALEYLQEEMAQ